MDAVIAAAARALAAGDPLSALNRVALRADAPGLALRGIAMAQLGEFGRAAMLLKRAARAFPATAAAARARCVVAEAEIALASRELNWPGSRLDAARRLLELHGDPVNAAHAAQIEIRRLLLIGRLDVAERRLGEMDPGKLTPALRAVHELMAAGIALRRLRTKPARAALARAADAALRAGIQTLQAEIESAARVLATPAARSIRRGEERLLFLEEIEALPETRALVVDACRHVVRQQDKTVSLTSRPVLFALARCLAQAWPDDAPRNLLVARAFRAKRADESHRARLRVEIARLRTLLQPLAQVVATPRGFALVPQHTDDVLVLAHLTDEPHAALLAFLADGEAWSSSALAVALGASQRSVQRALDVLAAGGKVQSFGRGRARRWTTPPIPGFATALLLPPLLPDV
jgi:hypothetical protein